MAVILAASVLIFPATAALYFAAPPFPHKALLTGAFTLAGLEKIWAMIIRDRRNPLLEARQDWTAVTVGAAYLAVMGLALGECYVRRTGIISPAAAVLGGGLYAGGLVLQYAAFAHLKRQWTIHLDREPADRVLVQSGPYRLLRHPLYAAYCLEAIGIPLVLHAGWALAFALLVFVPLEIQRAVIEERRLRETFGQAYRDYAARVGACWPGFRPARRDRP